MFFTHIDRLIVPVLPFLPVLTVGDYQKYLYSAQNTEWYANIIIRSEEINYYVKNERVRSSSILMVQYAGVSERDHEAFRNNLTFSMFVYSMNHLIFSYRSNK